MKRYIWLVCVFLCSIIAASSVGAGDFDGTRPLLISVIRVVECVPDGACREVTPASVELPQFLKIDFTKKTIRPADADDETPDTVIERMESVDGKLILQGAEDGYKNVEDGAGWTMSIEQDSGKGVLTFATPGAAVVVFGVCTPH